MMLGNFLEGSIFDDLFNTNLFKDLEVGMLPEGTKMYKKDILDANGKKIGEKTVSSFSSGRNKAPTKIVGNFPPCNIYTDEDNKLVYEFAVAGYDPENISFEANPEDPEYIDLVLKSDLKEVKDKKKDDVEDLGPTRIYAVEGFKVKDHRTPFYVDSRRYDVESAEYSVKNGVVKISFAPKKATFKAKLLK